MLTDSDQIDEKMESADRVAEDSTLLSSAYDAVEHARHYDPDRLVPALTTYIRLLTQDEQYDKAGAFAQEILQQEQRTSSAVEAYITLGICAAETNQLDQAEQYFHQAADLSRKIGYMPGLAMALRHLAHRVLFIRGQFQLALTFAEEASILFEEQGAKHWNEPFLRALIFQTLGDRRHSRQILDDLVLQVEPGTRLAAAYYFLWARLALDEEELEQAKEYLRLGLRVANRSGSADLNLWIRLEHCRYHRLKGEAAAARTWADDALQHAQRYGSHYFTGLALIERAQANWASEDSAAAEEDLEQACQVLSPLRAAYDLTRARFLQAAWQRQAGNPNAAAAWQEAANAMLREGYVFILEKEQDIAFPLAAAYMRSKTTGVRQMTEKLLRHLASVPPPPLRIATLGQFAVWKGRRRIPDQAWTRRKAGELFRFLLLQPNRAAGREVIIEGLWPDHPSDNPNDLLNQATSALRHALEPDLPDKFPSRYLKVEGEQITLMLPPGSVLDFEQFERALPLAIQSRKIDRLQEALNMYSGDLFPADRYADWSAEKRQALGELRQHGLLALAQAYLNQGQYYNVVNCCRQVLQVDAWNEDAVLYAMQAFAGLQNVPHALHLYQELAKTLKEELDIAPRSDLRSLAETLRRR